MVVADCTHSLVAVMALVEVDTHQESLGDCIKVQYALFRYQ